MFKYLNSRQLAGQPTCGVQVLQVALWGFCLSPCLTKPFSTNRAVAGIKSKGLKNWWRETNPSWNPMREKAKNITKSQVWSMALRARRCLAFLFWQMVCWSVQAWRQCAMMLSEVALDAAVLLLKSVVCGLISLKIRGLFARCLHSRAWINQGKSQVLIGDSAIQWDVPMFHYFFTMVPLVHEHKPSCLIHFVLSCVYVSRSKQILLNV